MIIGDNFKEVKAILKELRNFFLNHSSVVVILFSTVLYKTWKSYKNITSYKNLRSLISFILELWC